VSRPTALAALLTAVLVATLLGAAPGAAAPVREETVHEVAAQLRCVVCQSLSVADSPSETAHQMRGIIRERLAAGETADQVREYFVGRYGEWVLLSPRRSGFNLLVWGFPIAAIAVGLIVVALLLRRWTSRGRATMTSSALDAAMSERIRRDLDSER
jgi:cytochrome c-type biogenesis protein CcmH